LKDSSEVPHTPARGYAVVPFDEMPWAPGGHPLERKKGPVGKAVLLEFAPGFQDQNWCPRSHVIFVVAGELELELEHGTARAAVGQCVTLESGTRHRARNPGSEPTILFVVSDV
jgi:quercetin dioxygenase-like cupin family protein